MPTDSKPEPLMTLKEVAEWLGWTPEIVRRKAAAGIIPASKLDGTDWRFERQKVAEWIASQQVPRPSGESV